MRMTALFFGLCYFTWASLGYGAEPQDENRRFDVEAQGAASGLVEFGRQAKLQLLFSADAVKQVKTHAVQGSFEPTRR